MSDLFDECPMLIFALESLLALGLLIFIVLWTASGKEKARQRLDDPPRRPSRAAPRPQCNVRGIMCSANSATGISKRSPSSATQKYALRMVPTGVAITAQLVYSNCLLGLSNELVADHAESLHFLNLLFAVFVMTQGRAISCEAA